jgi:hypothetical protein
VVRKLVTPAAGSRSLASRTSDTNSENKGVSGRRWPFLAYPKNDCAFMAGIAHGYLTDIVNLSEAKNAAAWLVELTIFNQHQEAA